MFQCAELVTYLIGREICEVGNDVEKRNKSTYRSIEKLVMVGGK